MIEWYKFNAGRIKIISLLAGIRPVERNPSKAWHGTGVQMWRCALLKFIKILKAVVDLLSAVLKIVRYWLDFFDH